MNRAGVPLSQLLSYGLMAFPLAFVGLPLYMYVPDMYIVDHKFSLFFMGIVLMAIRLLDAIQDPLIGKFSDQFSHHRFVIMLSSFVIFTGSFFLLYHPIGNTKLWMVMMLLLSTTAYSVLTINLNAIGSLWSKNTILKTRIVSVREGLGVVGLLCAVMLLPFIQYIFPNTNSYHIYALVALSMTTVIGFIFFIWFYRYQHLFFKEKKKYKLKIKLILSPHTRQFYLIYSLSALASSIPAVLVLFFVRDRLNAENLTGLFLLLYFIAALVSMPIWIKLSVVRTKSATWLIAMIISCISFVGAFFLEQGDVVAYALICTVSGFSFGAELILPPSILSDIIDSKKHQQETSVYFSILAFITKFSLALASGLSLILLGKSEFLPATQNSDQSLLTLSFVYAIVPCVIKFVSIAFLIYWIRRRNKNETNTHTSSDRITHYA